MLSSPAQVDGAVGRVLQTLRISARKGPAGTGTWKRAGGQVRGRQEAAR
jgi:hypothetical protein